MIRYPLFFVLVLIGSRSIAQADLIDTIHSQEQELIELNLRLQLLNYRAQSLASPDDLVLAETLTQKLAELDDLSRQLRMEQESLKSELRELELEIKNESVNAQRRAWRDAIGTTFDRWTTQDGSVYQDVEIVEIYEGGVRIRHRNGASTLRQSDLTESQLNRFAIDPELARLTEQREAQANHAWHSRIESELALSSKKTESQSEKMNSRALASRPQHTRASSASSPLAEPPRPVGRSSRYRASSRSTRYYTDYYFFSPSRSTSPQRSCKSETETPQRPSIPRPSTRPRN